MDGIWFSFRFLENYKSIKKITYEYKYKKIDIKISAEVFWLDEIKKLPNNRKTERNNKTDEINLKIKLKELILVF